MKRSIPCRFLLFAVLTVASVSSWAQLRFVEGVDYKVLEGKPSSEKKVVEFFSYNCPHCYHFDPLVEEYRALAPEEYKFERVPVSFGRHDWQKSAEIYALAGLLNKRDALHGKVFASIHEQNHPFRNDKDVKAFFLENGVDEKAFDKVAGSDAAKAAFQRNFDLAREFKISSVPTFLVRDVYVVQLGRMQDAKELKELVDFLMRL